MQKMTKRKKNGKRRCPFPPKSAPRAVSTPFLVTRQVHGQDVSRHLKLDGRSSARAALSNIWAGPWWADWHENRCRGPACSPTSETSARFSRYISPEMRRPHSPPLKITTNAFAPLPPWSSSRATSRRLKFGHREITDVNNFHVIKF